MDAHKLRKWLAIARVALWRTAAISHRVAASIEHAVVLRNLGVLRTIVDIGACRGEFALAARYCLPVTRIHSFEPQAGPAATFRAVFASDALTTLHEVAIGPEVCEAAMHVSASDDSSSLLPISAAQDALFPGTAEVGTAQVRVAPLSALLPAQAIEEPALLKLDVQGFELEALKGCADLLDRFAWVYVECSFVELYTGQALAPAVIDLMRVHGCGLVGVHHTVYDRAGRAIQADFLFGREPIMRVAS